MKRALAVISLALCLAGIGYAQDTAPLSFTVRSASTTMLVQAPGPDEALAYLDRTLADLDFFQRNSYEVSLPDHPLFDGAATPSADPAARRVAFVEDVYRTSPFRAAMSTLSGYTSQLRTALERIAGWARYDGFEALDSVTVTLTLYGPGGSFDPDAGRIVLWTDSTGAFKGGGGLHTIIHEMIHLAVERGIAHPLQLHHGERERLVDMLAHREFADLLPDYRLQGGSAAPLDPFVAGIDLAHLRDSVAEYVREGRPN